MGYTPQIVRTKGLKPGSGIGGDESESVVSVIAGWDSEGWATDEMVGGREIFGCVLMFIAIIIAQLPDREYTKWVIFAV